MQENNNIIPENSNIIIDYHLNNLGKQNRNGYVAHAYCYAGECTLCFNAQTFKLSQGKCMIIVDNRFVDSITEEDDIKVVCIYISFAYLGQCVPKSNYGIVGTIRLFSNPVFDLLPMESKICRNNFEQYIDRINRPYHFREDMLASATQLFFLDFFEFHIRIYGNNELSETTALIMRRFLAMLEQGDYRKNREVAYYANKLCVVPKYLSEICRKVSGFGANYWITRFTVQDLRNHFRNRELTVNHIAAIFNFSSIAYLNRYIKRNLGVGIAELRE